MISRFQFGGAGNDRGFWVVLGLLLSAVLVPTAGLLYFINEAVGNQRVLDRQKLDNAYLGQLRLVNERIDSFWEQRAKDLDARTDAEPPAVFFEHCVRDGLADSVICLNPDGSPAYPSLAQPPQADPALHDPQWAAATFLEDTGKLGAAAQKYASIAENQKDTSSAGRATQASIRCLVASGQKEAAIRSIERQFVEAADREKYYALRLAYATSLDGRLILADELRLELQLMPPGRDYTLRARQLFGLVSNYARHIPSAQRLFLMDYMRSLTANPAFRSFPTYQGERLAERILSDGRATSAGPALRLSGLGDVWKLASPSGRVIAFFQTPTIIQAMRPFLEPQNSSLVPTFAVTPPGRSLPPHDEWMAAGSRLPGWRISSVAGSAASSSPASRQIAAYLWIGFLTIAAVAILALLGGRTLRRQIRIAHLKTDLVAAVSHELKTPLASMKVLVESLLRGERFEPKRTREYLELVARENSRLSRLIDNFLTFSRMERNRGRFDFARVRPEAVARATVESIGDRFAVELDVDSDLPPLYADENALVTVLLNLLDNAYKYTGDNRRIGLRVFFHDGSVSFAVSDNGIGIPERERRKIFRRFYQLDRRLARQTGGVGLGLSIVEFIVKAHHGAVSVASYPGSGSTFTISLPPSSSAAELAA